MTIHMNLGEKSYDIRLERGALGELARYVKLDRKVLLVTDAGVPQEHIDRVMAQLPDGTLFVAPQGEEAKSFPVLQQICAKMLEERFTRKDLVLALGGGVVGDLAGFAASCYMRGVDFVNIPTTTLSQIDSSIGGKTAINLNGVKNCVGAFYQPKLVLIDSDTLRTLPQRHFRNGLVEAVKAGLIADAELFRLFEQEDYADHLDEIIRRSLEMKRRVVEEDEKEQGLRRILNFGHTIGHGVESIYGLEGGKADGLLHGEAVAVGIPPMITDPALRERARAVLRRLEIDCDLEYDAERVYDVMTRDKKAHGKTISIVQVSVLGRAEVTDIPMESIREYLKGGSAHAE